MSDYRVLISCPLIQDAIDEYEDQFAEADIEYDAVAVDQQLSEAELLDMIGEYNGILAGDDELTREVLANAPNLKVISKWGVGTDNIDIEAADERGIAVFNTPGMFDYEVADVVIGYAIMLTRELHTVDRAVRQGDWETPRGISLPGKTMGILGVGDIGSAVARRAAGLGMNVVGHDIEQIPRTLKVETGIEPVSKEELLQRARIVSLHCTLTPETREVIDEPEIESLGPEGYLINTARGGLVNESALIGALENNRIAGAGLDVFATEPLPETSPLTGLDNVILGSHNAQNTSEAIARTNTKAVENLIQGLQG